MMNFQDKVIVITGGSMGIGKSLAHQAAAAGAKVIVTARDQDRLNGALAELRAQGYAVEGVAGDVSDLNDCARVIETAVNTFGGIDLLINNAGANMRGRIEDTDPDALRLVMDINFVGALYMTRLALPEIKKNRGGIVFVSSMAGVHGLPMYGVYSASKMALQALAESLKAELIDTGVYVGIAYVGLTENQPGKTIYDAKGQKTPKEDVNIMGMQPIEVVAKGILDMAAQRRFRRNFTLLGKINVFVNRISPGFVQYLLTRAFKKRDM